MVAEPITVFTLAQLAERAGAELRGEADLQLSGVGTLAKAGPTQVSFLSNPRYRSQLDSTRAGAIVMTASDAAAWSGNALVSANPYLAFARVAQCFAPAADKAPGIDPSAVIDSSARIAGSARIEAGCVVGKGVRLGENVRLGPNCTIGEAVVIGDDTELVANVVLLHDVHVGARCLLHPGVVVGADGFGQARDGERWEKVPQLGSVRIGNDVEIGANTTIDRGALEDTVIEDGVRLDNQIQVAHNVRIGANTAIAGCTAIAGSSTIGRRCMIAGGVGVAGHLEITDDVTVLAMTLVTHSIRQKGMFAGSHPIEEVHSWRKNNARLRQLDELARKVKRLERQLEAVLSEKAKNNE